MPSILIVNSAPIVRAGLRSVLQGAGFTHALSEVNTPQEALDHVCTELALVIMDPREPAMSIAVFLSALRKNASGCPILFFGGNDVSLFAALASSLGVNGYLGQHSSEQTIAATARMVLDGMQCFPQAVGGSQGHHGHQSDRLQSLTKKELTVLTLLRQGLRNKDVARRLFLSEKTISAHKRNILMKLGVSGVMQISEREMVTESLNEQPADIVSPNLSLPLLLPENCAVA
ncbi:response regulator [Pusillimonas sp. TS35]|uniref:response regulator transcription factor n=1 Tax=Paracandidimonas lactea TaxID=2895524 RepID=UPI00136DD675|nr:response regulator transcription factor [Paracandidimonas lactea]MYN13497.1 response regulator [Pusillimonas sp. TS35]